MHGLRRFSRILARPGLPNQPQFSELDSDYIVQAIRTASTCEINEKGIQMVVVALEQKWTSSNSISLKANELLRERLPSATCDITCEYKEGMILLRGQLSSFYHKQLAQEAVRKLDGVQQVVNRIEVPWAT